jgi:predicted RNA methylase
MNKGLKNIADVLLNQNSYEKELLDASHQLASFFESFSSISTNMQHYEAKEDGEHILLDSGIAISPLDAAICTKEYKRTTLYIRGIFEALQDLMLTFKGQKINLLYAGSGPYATLIIPILHFFDSKKLGITFLDINSISLESVKNIIVGLGLDDYVNEYIQSDATTYQTTKKTHIIVTETMKAAFYDEPQVSITLNLLPQLISNGIFIPQKVVVGFELASTKYETKDGLLSKIKESKHLCDVINLDTLKPISKENIICTKECLLTHEVDEKMQGYFSTTIHIYKDNILGENMSSLNMPKKMKFDKKLLKGDCISFDYEFIKEPRIKYTRKEEKKKVQ